MDQARMINRIFKNIKQILAHLESEESSRLAAVESWKTLGAIAERLTAMEEKLAWLDDMRLQIEAEGEATVKADFPGKAEAPAVAKRRGRPKKSD